MNLAESRGATKFGIEIQGLAELQSQFEKLGKMPKKYLTKSAKAGMIAPERDAKASAPVGKRTTTKGTLKKSIKKKMETPNKRNKAVYRLRYDPKYTPIFQKPTTGVYGGETPYAFYPNSVEFGFKTKKGRVQGQYNMKKAMERHTKDSLQKVVNSLNESITELLGR